MLHSFESLEYWMIDDLLNVTGDLNDSMNFILNEHLGRGGKSNIAKYQNDLVGINEIYFASLDRGLSVCVASAIK